MCFFGSFLTHWVVWLSVGMLGVSLQAWEPPASWGDKGEGTNGYLTRAPGEKKQIKNTNVFRWEDEFPLPNAIGYVKTPSLGGFTHRFSEKVCGERRPLSSSKVFVQRTGFCQRKARLMPRFHWRRGGKLGLFFFFWRGEKGKYMMQRNTHKYTNIYTHVESQWIWLFSKMNWTDPKFPWMKLSGFHPVPMERW